MNGATPTSGGTTGWGCPPARAGGVATRAARRTNHALRMRSLRADAIRVWKHRTGRRRNRGIHRAASLGALLITGANAVRVVTGRPDVLSGDDAVARRIGHPCALPSSAPAISACPP